ncbi:hypothetical protein G7B40_006390 [Aetokthonos hydrillicola Thurmond2011]|jgi:hypothetical protein|uniref:Uncharacterized protein n=1 Tax=Aetokthonos hydrillicola Thurmond2011 TaxID=2712845 RepID=A0AAP5M3V4_9CYAN|nr:hypothetical protein [Aetokthonos hydrillicola]MBO3458595.1 hypothetical protein [Aetokthonos hydrillicola CCALA 1050]MBW4585038.1 hypothetical protein [Aetokthonos hydrillicola CCALA 1050]MDR9894201.1 hypothetical protein [Aetokthonos hydrillicola Thurmond2011]
MEYQATQKDWLKNKSILDVLVLIYTISGFFISFYLILVGQIWVNLLGIILITHTSIWAALLTHEFMHDTIFQKPKLNYIFGVLMTIISGACYVPYRLKYGEGLQKSVIIEPGDFIYIPGNVPHQPINLSQTEPVKSIVACNFDVSEQSN